MSPKPAAVMRLYGWLFLLCGAVFVAFPGPLMELIGLGAALIPGARPLPGGEPSYWLVLTGSMMAMISYLSFAVAARPALRVAWNALLLSKGMSTALFALFALERSNTLFFVGSAVDGAIFLHLLWLRRHYGPGYSVWFLKLNDPKTRDALWVRYTTLNGQATCWYVLFDAAGRRTHAGQWDVPGGGAPDGLLSARTARAEGPGVSWELAWSPGASPPFAFVPRFLAALGLAGTVYETPVSSALFSGHLRLDGAVREFSQAPGSIGHLRGTRMGDNWRWAHAVFEDGSVFEILSAQARWGCLRSPRLTSAHLWRGGRHFVSAGLSRGLSNWTGPSGAGWNFRVDFGEFAAEGECSPSPAMTAVVAYTDTDGRRLRCANSKTAAMRIELTRCSGEAAGSLETADTAAVETVAGEPAGTVARWALPYASAYARLAGVSISDEALESGLARRAAMIPLYARAAAAAGALFVRLLSPLLLLGRWACFESLSTQDADRLLQRLQASRSLSVKCLFFPLRAITLPEIYGRPERMERFGYGAKEGA